MGCAQSRESNHNNHNNNRDPTHYQPRSHRRPHPPHTWDEKPSISALPRPPPTHQRRRQQQHHHHHQDDPETAYAQRRRDAAERDVNRQALKQWGVSGEEKARLRTHYREEARRKGAEGRAWVREEERRRRRLEGRGKGKGKGGEEITVYAGPEVRSRWSDWST